MPIQKLTWRDTRANDLLPREKSTVVSPFKVCVARVVHDVDSNSVSEDIKRENRHGWDI